MTDTMPPRQVTALHRNDYLSQDVFERELRQVFAKQWLVVGHVSLVRSAGDYFVKQVGPESLLIARDKEMRLRAYFNVCRHRGFRLCSDGESGNARRLTCPYHGWSYGIDGALRTAPGARDAVDFDFSQLSLHEAWCDVYQGFILVYLDKDSPPRLADSICLSSNEELFSMIHPERMKLAHRETYVVNANWKALLENDMECYHCPTSHPSLSVACNVTGFYADSRSGMHFPLRDGMKTFSIDGDWVCRKPLGDSLPDRFSCGFLLWPNFCGPVFFADHCVSLETTPLSVDKTQMIAEWYVHEQAVEGVDYDREQLIKVFDVTNREDARLTERNFSGIRSMRYVPGPLSATREDGVSVALDRYRQMMMVDDADDARRCS